MAVGAGSTTADAEPSPLAGLDTTPRLARQTLTYAVSGLIGPAIAVLTLPVFARVFTQAQYGVLELGTTLTTLALTVTDLGLIAAAQRSYFDYGDDAQEERRVVLATAFLTTTALTFVVAAGLFLQRDTISDWLFGRNEATVLAIVAVSLLPLSTFRFMTETMRLRFQATHYLVTSAIATIVSSGLAVAAVVVFDYGLEGVFAAALIGNALACLYGLAVVGRAIFGAFSKRHLRVMLIFGLPLVPTTLTAWLLALIDRLILAKLGDLDEVGLYAIATRLTILITIGINAFMLAAVPFLFSLFADDPSVEKVARGRVLTYFTFILTSAALIASLFAHEVLSVLAPGFVDAYKAVGPASFGLVAYGLAALLTTGFALARRTGRLALLSLVAAIVNVGLNVALIPPFGYVGSAFATAAGYVALAATYYWAGQRVYPTPYEARRVVTIFAAGAVTAVVGVLPLEDAAVAVPIKLGALALFIGILWITRAMTRAEFTELRRFITEMVPRRAQPAG
jgi:antigen flippase